MDKRNAWRAYPVRGTLSVYVERRASLPEMTPRQIWIEDESGRMRPMSIGPHVAARMIRESPARALTRMADELQRAREELRRQFGLLEEADWVTYDERLANYMRAYDQVDRMNAELNALRLMSQLEQP